MKIKDLSVTKAFARYGVAFLSTIVVMTSLGCEKKPSCVITGSVDGASDEDSVYLEVLDNGELRFVASAPITNDTFRLEGQIDTVAAYYLSCGTESNSFSTPIFLDGPRVTVRLEEAAERIVGTPANDAYQEIRSKVNETRGKMMALEADTTLTDEEQNQRYDQLDEEYEEIFRDGIKKNIANRVGLFLFKQRYWYNNLRENLELLSQIPKAYHSDPELVGLKAMFEQQKETDVMRLYTDLELQTPEGKSVRLSDYVGKGKPVLIDFWASWCGPCRQSMPQLVELYAKYKDQFEIVGISLDEDREAWQSAITKLGITWPQMSDLKGWSSIAAKEYGVNAIPHTILIDKEGVILARELEGEHLEQLLVSLF
ncbi:MAG: TlpA disulfide reductase family protein [Porphyromonadaceae bacterium]|nr:TlpA disulfide reductase family protein [Porphyromonadaceae bacterium]